MADDKKVNLFTLDGVLADLIICDYPGIIKPEDVLAERFGDRTRHSFRNLPFSSMMEFLQTISGYFSYELDDSLSGEVIAFSTSICGEGRTIVDKTTDEDTISELVRKKSLERVLNVANEVAAEKGFKNLTVSRGGYAYKKVGESLGAIEIEYSGLVCCEFSKRD